VSSEDPNTGFPHNNHQRFGSPFLMCLMTCCASYAYLLHLADLRTKKQRNIGACILCILSICAASSLMDIMHVPAALRNHQGTERASCKDPDASLGVLQSSPPFPPLVNIRRLMAVCSIQCIWIRNSQQSFSDYEYRNDEGLYWTGTGRL